MIEHLRTIIENYEQLLDEMGQGPLTSSWAAERRLTNLMLRSCLLQDEYFRATATNPKDLQGREDVDVAMRRATALRIEIYRQRKEMIKRGW